MKLAKRACWFRYHDSLSNVLLSTNAVLLDRRCISPRLWPFYKEIAGISLIGLANSATTIFRPMLSFG
jgi:hypothetical protein